jgi:microcystin-dependent protein
MAAFGAPSARGQPISTLTPSGNALFSILFTSFGGGGPEEVTLPDLSGRVTVGGQQLGLMSQYSLSMNWLIATGSSSLAPMPGMMAMFGGIWAPDGWLICDGSVLPISQNIPLFEAIGATYGGNGQTVFQLPNLAGPAPVGAGQGPGRPPVALGRQVPGTVPGVGVNYLIATEGQSPPDSGQGAFPDTGQYLGQVIAYGGGRPPAGWALCDGSTIPIAGNEPLFEVIGATYGGDGESDFALPDLRGRMVMGSSG